MGKVLPETASTQLPLMSILRGFSIKLATRGSTCAIEIVAIDHLLSVRAELFETTIASCSELLGTMLVLGGGGKQPTTNLTCPVDSLEV